MRTAIEEDLVADISTEAEPSGERFDTATGIEHPVQVGAAQLRREVAEGDWNVRRREAHESTLSEHECAQPLVRADLELRSEREVSGAESDRAGAATGRGGGANTAGAEPGDVIADVVRKIIRPIHFEFHMWINGETEASADAEQIRVGSICAEVVSERTDFGMVVIVILRKCGNRYCQHGAQDGKENTLHGLTFSRGSARAPDAAIATCRRWGLLNEMPS